MKLTGEQIVPHVWVVADFSLVSVAWVKGLPSAHPP